MISFYDVDEKIDQSSLKYLKSYIDDYIVTHRCCVEYPNCTHPKEQSDANLLNTNDTVISMVRNDLFDKLQMFINDNVKEITYFKCWALKNKGTDKETWHTHILNKNIKEVSFIMYLDDTELGTEFDTENYYMITKPKKLKWLFFNSNILHQPKVGNQKEDRYIIAGAIGVKQ